MRGKRKTFTDRMPKRLVPIASDSFGNQICIAVSGDDRGSIFFWDHEKEADEGEGESPETIGNVTLIADSFSAFLDLLH